MFNHFYFGALFKFTRAFNLPVQNASHFRFMLPAKLNIVLTISSCRSLVEAWNSIFLRQSQEEIH
jgi:hypothetical protein